MTDSFREIVSIALNALERLLKLFRIERILHLCIGIIGFVLLVYAIIILLMDKKMDTTMLVALFGTSGLITASSARITFFFNKAFRLVEDIIKTLLKQMDS